MLKPKGNSFARVYRKMVKCQPTMLRARNSVRRQVRYSVWVQATMIVAARLCGRAYTAIHQTAALSENGDSRNCATIARWVTWLRCSLSRRIDLDAEDLYRLCPLLLRRPDFL